MIFLVGDEVERPGERGRPGVMAIAAPAVIVSLMKVLLFISQHKI
jgi:hypothetical protein